MIYLAVLLPERRVWTILDSGAYSTMADRMGQLAGDNPSRRYMIGSLRDFDTFGRRYEFPERERKGPG